MNNMFVLYVVAHPVKKKKDGLKLSWIQSKVVKTIVDNMTDTKFPKQDDGKYIVIVDTGNESECKTMEEEFWNTGTVKLQEKINKNIDNDRITPKWLKNKFKKLIAKGEKVKDYFVTINTCFHITTTTHILPEMENKELEDYFRSLEIGESLSLAEKELLDL